jgi:hypothetical protein
MFKAYVALETHRVAVFSSEGQRPHHSRLVGLMACLKVRSRFLRNPRRVAGCFWGVMKPKATERS